MDTNVSRSVQVSFDELIRLRFQLVKIKLPAPKSVMTTLAGGYPSSFRGRGMEFMETRHYQPGDDIRAIDWRVTARTGKTHRKLFREERERPIFLLVDYGPSMFFGTKKRFKSVVAAYAAAWFAWVAKAHGDRVGGLIFSVNKPIMLPPAGGQRSVLRFIKALVDNQPCQGGDVQTGQLDLALAQLRQVAHPGSLVYLISDFRGLDKDGETHLKRLALHHDIMAVFIYDPLERTLPSLPGNYEMTDGQQILSFNSAELCQVYQERFEQRATDFETFFKQQGAHWRALATDSVLPAALL